ncbi:DDHD domain protein [Cordyceps javanica]|nr:DDHD domain protein [Cordyceps javanica]
MCTNDEGASIGKPKDSGTQETPYWSSAFSSIGIWNGAKPPGTQSGKDGAEEAKTPNISTATNHLTTPFHGQSFRSYPKDCPRPTVRWFHAVDAPKRTTLPPFEVKGTKEAKVPAKPKRFSAFNAEDSKRIESQYQTLLEVDEELRNKKEGGTETKPQRSSSELQEKDVRVPVNEDFLFDVSVKQRELCPVYWPGPVYEVRRGTWFYQDGTNLRPCEETLAAQLEEGYLKMKAWIEPEKKLNPKQGHACTTTARNETFVAAANRSTQETEAKQTKLKSHRLFGIYMNNTVTYEDASTAWLVSDGVLSWVAASAYERFAGGGHMSGVKLIRGFSDQNKAKEKEKSDKTTLTAYNEDRKVPTEKPYNADADASNETSGVGEAARTGKTILQRRLSTIIESEDRRTATSERDVRKLNEEEMRHDYHTQHGESQNRDIEHLVLVTHGIGQRLGLRTQSVNFIHDVNVLRKTLKGVYTNSPELRSMNVDDGKGPGNCRIQVLPVCWRHNVDFPRGKKKKMQADETDVAAAHDEEETYPTLEDITIDGVAFARSLISDLALDVLLYQSSYRTEIAQTVIEESNRIVDLFRQRNPNFQGKIHLVGHSLGSAILFDILCHENRQRRHEPKPNPLRFLPHHGPTPPETNDTLDFDVEDFYCLGSPIGLFQMLTGRTIAARPADRNTSKVGLARTIDSENMDDEFLPGSGFDYAISRPDAQQLFNIFYPSDPISYRLEPLISPSMASMKPHNLPYTKKSLFGVVGSQGLTGIGTKVGQSVSGLFASLSTGLSTNLLPSSLRISSEEAQGIMKESRSAETYDMSTRMETKERETEAGSDSQGPEDEEALLDQSSQIATLYSRFQMNDERSEEAPEVARGDGKDHKNQKRRKAQRKVWALNRNGRVDFSIQEGPLDFNPISTIASHIGYWGEEDRPSDIRQIIEDAGMSVDDAPEDDGNHAPRQSYNFAPGYYGAVYRADTPDYGAGPDPDGTAKAVQHRDDQTKSYKLQSMKWGLIPFWSKRNPDYASMLKTINCRSDSLSAPGGMWATMKARKRCIVIAQGFYEWLKTGPKDKLPHYIKRADDQLMCFAGLWDCVQYQDSDEKLYTFTIITTDSNKQLKFLHDRMPVILEPGSCAMRQWLDPNTYEWSRDLQSLLQPFHGDVEVYPVTKDVGKVGNDSAAFIKPLYSRDNKSNIANYFSGPVTEKAGSPKKSEAKHIVEPKVSGEKRKQLPDDGLYNKWHETELERWLSDHGIPHPKPADRKDIEDLVQKNWNDYVIEPYRKWSPSELSTFLVSRGKAAKAGADETAESLMESVKANWYGSEEAAGKVVTETKDWILDTWSDSQLKALCDKQGIPVPATSNRDALLAKARRGFEVGSQAAGETLSYPGDWLYESWSDSDLKKWLDKNGFPAPQRSNRNALVAAVRRNSHLAYLKGQEQEAKVRARAKTAYAKVTDEVIDAWSESDLKKFADENGISVPQGTKLNEFRAAIRQHRAEIMGHDVHGKATKAFGAATSRASNEYAKASEDATLIAQRAFEEASSTWSESRLKAYLDARGIPVPQNSNLDSLRALVRKHSHKAASGWTAWTFDDFDTETLQKYLQKHGDKAAKAASKKADATRDELVKTAQAAYAKAEKKGGEGYEAAKKYGAELSSEVKDNAFEAWSESDLKAYLDSYGVPVPQSSSLDELKALARKQWTYFKYGTTTPHGTLLAQVEGALASGLSWLQKQIRAGSEAAKEKAGEADTAARKKAAKVQEEL